MKLREREKKKGQDRHSKQKDSQTYNIIFLVALHQLAEVTLEKDYIHLRTPTTTSFLSFCSPLRPASPGLLALPRLHCSPTQGITFFSSP